MAEFPHRGCGLSGLELADLIRVELDTTMNGRGSGAEPAHHDALEALNG